jgi:hypothetical protein
MTQLPRLNREHFYWLIIAVMFIMMVLQRSCTPACPTLTPVTVVRIDTIFHEKKADTVYVPKVKQSAYRPKPVFSIGSGSYLLIDAPSGSVSYESKDSSVQDEEVTIYQDTTRFQLPMKGYFVVVDTVQGKIINRRIVQNYSIPIINTTTERTYPVHKPRSQLYIGGEVLGSPVQLLEYGGISMAWKTKRDVIYEIKTLVPLSGGRQLYGIGIKTKISFRPF